MHSSRFLSFIVTMMCFVAYAHRMPTADDFLLENLERAHAQTTGTKGWRAGRQRWFIIDASRCIRKAKGHDRRVAEFWFGVDPNAVKILTETNPHSRISDALFQARREGAFIVVTLADDDRPIAWPSGDGYTKNDFVLLHPERIQIRVVPPSELVVLKGSWPGGPYRALEEAPGRNIRLFEAEQAHLDTLLSGKVLGLLCTRELLDAQRPGAMDLDGRCFVVAPEFVLPRLPNAEVKLDLLIPMDPGEEYNAVGGLLWESLGRVFDAERLAPITFGELIVLPPLVKTDEAPLRDWIEHGLRVATAGMRAFDVVAPIRRSSGEWILVRIQRSFNWRHPVVGELVVCYYPPLDSTQTSEVKAGIFAALDWKQRYAFEEVFIRPNRLPERRWPGLDIARQLRQIVGARRNDNNNNINNDNNAGVVSAAARVQVAGSIFQ
jgi:hypothetical protein